MVQSFINLLETRAEHVHTSYNRNTRKCTDCNAFLKLSVSAQGQRMTGKKTPNPRCAA